MLKSLFGRFYQLLIYVGSNLQSFFLLAIRLFWGSSFFMTGLGKLQNIPAITEYFAGLGIPFPLFNAYAASSVECIGGACLVLGLGSRLASLGLMGVMVVALLTADHEALVNAFDDPQKLITRLPFTYLYTSLVVFIFGPGKVSIDYLMEKRWTKTMD
jgi:putative oxidoreductase